MPLYLTARNPTDAVTHGLLPAAASVGLDTVLLTDLPAEHAAAYSGHPQAPVAVVETPVGDAAAVAARVLALAPRFGTPDALLSNSDHLQSATALAAELLGLPGKPWAAAVRCKNKFLTRATLAAAGLDAVTAVEIAPGEGAGSLAELTYPAVLKPREGVAGEDVVLVGDRAELLARVGEIRARRPGAELLAEEYLPGPLRTYETLGDATVVRHVGSWRTTLGPPPHFTETRLDWDPVLPDAAHAHLRAQLAALGVCFGACHTEFVVDGDRARIIEVNYRLIGDTMDLICCDLLGVDLFAALIRLHLGESLSDRLPDPIRVPLHARVDYVVADRAGRLVAAPPEGMRDLAGGVRLGHRALRATGTTVQPHGSNRDYLAVLHAIGPDPAGVGSALDGFRAGHDWVVEPVAVGSGT